MTRYRVVCTNFWCEFITGYREAASLELAIAKPCPRCGSSVMGRAVA